MALVGADEFRGDDAYCMFEVVHAFIDLVVAGEASVNDAIDLINHVTM